MDTIHTLNDNSGIISEPGKVRVIMRDGEPWFVASDVATALGYDNPQKAIIDHCKRAEILKGNESLLLTTSPRGINIIPESDVYRLIMRSNLPGAERFQDWVCEEVLPSIRKRGVYATDDVIDAIIANPDMGIKLLTELKAEREARAQAELCRSGCGCPCMGGKKCQEIQPYRFGRMAGNYGADGRGKGVQSVWTPSVGQNDKGGRY